MNPRAWRWVLALLLGSAAWGFAETPLSSTGTVAMASAHDTPQVLTLDESLKLALGHATEVLKAQNLFTFSGVQLWQAYLEFLPSVVADANTTWTQGHAYYTIGSPTTVNTRSHSANYQLNGDFNLFNGFGDYAGLNASQRRRANARLSLYRARQQIVLDVTQAYLQVLLDEQLVHIDEANLTASQAREKLLDAESQGGIRSLADLYRQQAETSADSLALINARNQARTDLLLLLRRLRVDLTRHYALAEIVVDSPTVTDPYRDEQALLSRAVRQRADLAASHKAVEAAEWDITTARSGYYPRLDLVGSLSGTGSVLSRQIVNGVDMLPASQDPLSTQLRDHVLYTGGLALTWGLFERYRTGLAVGQAQYVAKNARIDDEDLVLQVEADVQQVSGDYQAALERLNVAAVGMRAAQESLDAVKARYDVGASSIVDLLTAQSTLVQAQSADAQARIGYMLERKTLENVVGDTHLP